MRIKVERKWRKDAYTIGRLYVNGEYFCNTLEDKDRGLKKSDTLQSIKGIKVFGETAIPVGVYEVAMNVVSPKYVASPWYKQLCGGRMPRLKDVPGFDGVLIHAGNTALDTNGCVLVGKNTKAGQVTSSRDTFKTLYQKMKAAADAGEKIEIEIAW